MPQEPLPGAGAALPGPPAAPAFARPAFAPRVEVPLPLSIAEFGFEEDKLLLSAFWANCLPDTASDAANLALCRLYARARERDCILFPKPERYTVYSRALLSRLDELLHSPACEALVALAARDLELSQKRAADVMRYYAGEALSRAPGDAGEVGVPGAGPSPGFGGVFWAEGAGDGQGPEGARGRAAPGPPGGAGAGEDRFPIHSADALAAARELAGMTSAAETLGPGALGAAEAGLEAGLEAARAGEAIGAAGASAAPATDESGPTPAPPAAPRPARAPSFSLLVREPRSQGEERSRLAAEVERYGAERVTLLVPVLGTFTALRREHPLITDLISEFASRLGEHADARYLPLHSRRAMLTRNSEFLARVLYDEAHGGRGVAMAMTDARGELRAFGPPDRPEQAGRGAQGAQGDLDSFLAEDAPGDFLDRTHPSLPDEHAIILSDALFPATSECHSHVADFCHFDPGLVARFLLFCRHPSVILEQKYLREDVQKAEELLQEATEDFAKLVDGRRMARMGDLAAWARGSEERICAEVLFRFSQDVADVRRRYESLLRTALAQLNRLHNQYKVEALEYYENALAVYKAKLESVFSHGKRRAGVDRRLSDLRRLEEAIFYPLAMAPRVVVLAAALESEPLMQAATSVLAREILKPDICASDVLIRCRLVSTGVYQQILQKVETKDLAKLFVHAQINGCAQRADCANPEVCGSALQQGILTANSTFEMRGGDSAVLVPGALGDSHAGGPAPSVGASTEGPGPLRAEPSFLGTRPGLLFRQPTISDRPFAASRSFTSTLLGGAGKILIVPFEFLEDEVAHRKAHLYAVYSRWSDERVRAAIAAGDEPFPEVLTQALKDREAGAETDDVGAVVLAEVPWLYSLDPSRLTATLKVERRFAIVQPVQHLSSGLRTLKVYFEVAIRHVEGATIAVGVLYDREIYARMPGLDSGAERAGAREGGKFGNTAGGGLSAGFSAAVGGSSAASALSPGSAVSGAAAPGPVTAAERLLAAHTSFPGSTAGNATREFLASAMSGPGAQDLAVETIRAGPSPSVAKPPASAAPAPSPGSRSELPDPLDTPAANGVCITSDGYLLQMGRRTYTGEVFAARDVIGVLVDMGAETVSFLKNGRAISEPHSFQPAGLVAGMLNLQSARPRPGRGVLSQAVENLRGTPFTSNGAPGVPEAAAGSASEPRPGPDAPEPESPAVRAAYSALRGAGGSLDAELLAQEERERAVDSALEERVDAALRAGRAYAIRPAAVLYSPELSRALGAPRPCVRFAFGAPFTYECPPGYGGTGYDTLLL